MNIKLFVTLMLCSFASICQISNDDKLEKLERKVQLLTGIITKRDSIDYLRMKESIITAFLKSEVTVQKYSETMVWQQNLKVQTMMNRMLNPTGNLLGFKFTDVIMKAAQEKLVKNLETADSNRFLTTIDKITSNKIIDTFIKSNPIASVVSSVISAAANFLTIRTADKKLIHSNPILNENIKEFETKLKPIIEIYAEFERLNKELENSIPILNEKYSKLETTSQNYTDRFLQSFDKGIDLGDTVQYKAFTIIEEELRVVNNDYLSVLNKKSINQALKVAIEFPQLSTDISNYKNDFNKLLLRYLTGSLTTSEKFRLLKSDFIHVDLENLQEFQNEIKKTIALMAKKSRDKTFILKSKSQNIPTIMSLEIDAFQE